MAATASVAIGTRGTIGSLIKKEIDYFAKIELERCSSRSSQRPQAPDMATSGCSSSPPTFWHSVMSWRRKKKRSRSRFVPKICSSAFDVSESNQMNKISGFNYTILQNNFHSLHM
ncbi:hypothetical protein SDJN03_20009, partial [Cucurbita argyrosperma subsp. sororia]